MHDIIDAFERHIEGHGVCIKKRANGKYLMKSTRVAFSQFKAIYMMGFEAGCKETALQGLADQAQELNMGY